MEFNGGKMSSLHTSNDKKFIANCCLMDEFWLGSSYLDIVNEAVVVVLDFTELQEVQAGCKGGKKQKFSHLVFLKQKYP